MVLRIAVAWGYIDEASVKEGRELQDRLLAILWRLTHPPVAPVGA